MITREKLAKVEKMDRDNKKSPLKKFARPSISHDQIQQLHSYIGNQAIQKLLEQGAIQAKLKIGKANDKYELEADSVADQVMRMSDHTVMNNSSKMTEHDQPKVQHLCPVSKENLKRQPLQEKDLLLAKASQGHSPQVTPNVAANMQSLQSSGQPLTDSTRYFFETRFARDFSDVRIHTGTQAANTAQSVQAKAFTVGRDIVFGTGEFQPQIIEGKRLIAHELTHVIQQSNDRTHDNQGQTAYASVYERTPPRIARQGLESAEEAKRKKLVIQNVRFTLDEKKEVDIWFEKLKSGRWGTIKDLGLPVKLNGIDDSYRTPMTSIASMLASVVLKPNKTLTVNLKLEKHGLADANYRFSWVGTAKKGTVYIELLGAGPKAETKPKITKSKDGKTPKNGTITIGKLTFNYKNWDAGQLRDLERALSLTPMSALEKVDGMTFEIKVAAGSTTEDGHYDIEKHTVIVYTKTWKESVVRMGESTRAVDLIAHEIGHAVDLAPLRVAAAPLKSRSLSGVKVSSKTMRIYEPLAKRVTKGRDKGKLAAGETDFRKAAEKDGVVPKTKKGKTLKLGVTEYGKTDYQQLFAESFTLYVNDPELFKLIRPNIYDYFLKHYPRKPVVK